MSSLIIRAPRPEVGYTVIRNEVLRDNRLSYRDRGLLAYMLSHTDNWRFSVETLSAQGVDGKQALYASMKSLEEAGYLTRKRVHDKETGKFDWQTFVYDLPQDSFDSPVTPKRELQDPINRQAALLVKDVWEPAVVGQTSQAPIAVVRIVETALRNGITAPRCAKALGILAATKTTVTQYQFDRALNGTPVKGQLNADKQKDWSAIKSGAQDGLVTI